MICEYGCNREAKYQFKNGKWCCENHHSKCPVNRKKNSKFNMGKKSYERNENIKQILRDKIIIWHKNNKNEFKEIIKKRKIIGNRITTTKLCDYGCGYIAKYKFKNGKLCCSDHYWKCKSSHKKAILNQKPEKIITTELCDYGCGNIANYILPKSKKYCCSSNWAKCTNIRKKNSKTNSIKQKGENNARYGVKLTVEERRNVRLGNLRDLENKHGQIVPNYNLNACKLIEEYGNQHGYNFQHAENGGEFHIKDLGYWVDGYDVEKNVVIEVDESHHFDYNGNLIERDIRRQKEITEFLRCEFIRIKNIGVNNAKY